MSVQQQTYAQMLVQRENNEGKFLNFRIPPAMQAMIERMQADHKGFLSREKAILKLFSQAEEAGIIPELVTE